MRYLAIDLGDKRTGLAIGDAVTRIAAPLDVLEIPLDRRSGDDLLEAIVGAIDEHIGDASAELVVGLPLNMDGTESPRSRNARAFARRLAERSGRAVHLQDERRSTDEAHGRMARSGLTRKQKKQRRDAIAAANILDGFLQTL